jgi:DNA polymerase
VVLYRTGFVSRGNYIDTRDYPSKYPLILFIGEAPGEQEDHTGLPFQGPSGRILHMLFRYIHSPFAYCITNTVACRPTIQISETHVENREPTPEERLACKPRLDQLVKQFTFDGVVYLGKIAEEYRSKDHNGPKNLFTRTVTLLHPAAIARMEFKLGAIKTQARKLEQYVVTTTQAKTESTNRS